MKKFLFKTLIILLLLVGIIGVGCLFHTLSDGFSITSITSAIPYNKNWDISIDPKDLDLRKEALDQPYSYLKSGSQSYVFISEDGQFVIKFFKHKRWRLNAFFKAFPLPIFLEKKRQRWLDKKQETIESTFQSCISSYQDLKKETGVIYLHLNKSKNLNKMLEISDRIGFKHLLNLDKIEFTIQQVAIPTDTYLLTLRKSGKTGLAKEAITSLLNLTIKRAHLGYSDKDPHLIYNFGFIKEKAVEIDIGGFHKDPKKDCDYFYEYELLKIRQKFLPWIKKNYPELISYTEKQIKQIIRTRQAITP